MSVQCLGPAGDRAVEGKDSPVRQFDIDLNADLPSTEAACGARVNPGQPAVQAPAHSFDQRRLPDPVLGDDERDSGLEFKAEAVERAPALHLQPTDHAASRAIRSSASDTAASEISPAASLTIRFVKMVSEPVNDLYARALSPR